MYYLKLIKSLRNLTSPSKISVRCCHKLKKKYLLNPSTISNNVKEMKYAVRGPILQRAKELRKELEEGAEKPFKELVLSNLGDAQAMGQPPLTFLRQVVALTILPELCELSNLPKDAVSRALQLMYGSRKGQFAGEPEYQGNPVIRQHVAEYIMTRDGIDPLVEANDIVLTDGASVLIKAVLQLFTNAKDDLPVGCMIPMPGYPLYSATVTEIGLHQINYYLDESRGWELTLDCLNEAIKKAKKCCVPRILVLINPGNPTGSLFSQKSIEDAIKFANEEKLFILADEVYQENVHSKDAKFVSVRKVMIDLGMPFSRMECISFNSLSKGLASECGLRSGYGELFNMDKCAKRVLHSLLATGSCPNSVGQVGLDVYIHPPKACDPSHQKFIEEKNKIAEAHKTKATKVSEMLNEIKGVKCTKIEGALYAFPKIQLPDKFLAKCAKLKKDPNEQFCLDFLNATGNVTVPGSGFGQVPGTYHFRTTILPSMEKLEKMVADLKCWMKSLNKTYK